MSFVTVNKWGCCPIWKQAGIFPHFPFSAYVPVEALLVPFHLLLFSALVLILFMLESGEELLFHPCSSPATFAWYSAHWVCPFLCLKENQPALLDHSCLQSWILGNSSQHFSEPGLWSCCFLPCFVHSDPELCHLRVITAKAAPDLHIPDWLFLRSRRVPSLFDFQFSCVGMLSLMPSWMVVHTISPLRQISGSENLRFLPVIWRTPVVQAIPNASKTVCLQMHTDLCFSYFHPAGSAVQFFREALRCADLPESVWDFSPYAWETLSAVWGKEENVSNIKCLYYPGLLQIQEVILPWHIGWEFKHH